MGTGERITTLAGNGPPPDAAGTVYLGQVMHARLKPFGHRFVYSVFSILVDIDRLDDLARSTPLLGVNRAGPASFHERDHVERPGETLRAFVDRHLAAAGGSERADRVLLLAYPRILGYVFNPISVYFAYASDGDLIAMIYAVRNTFGERHTYVAPIRPGDLTPAGVRQTRAKILHVSPFVGMQARYHFRVLPPGRTVRLRIHETEDDDALLSATFNGDAAPLDTPTLGIALLRYPFMTAKVMAGIHWEAMKLWWKGARFHKSPPPPAPASYRDTGVPEPCE
jgi:DUF1365 family protein